MKKLLLVLPIMALLAAGCSTSQQTSNSTSIQTSVSQNSNQPSSPTPTSDQQSNAKIYTNTTYGFQLSYPSDWSTREYGQATNYFINFTGTSPANNFGIQIRDLTTVDNGKDLQDLKNELASSSNIVNGFSAAHINISGVTAIRLIHLDPSPSLREDNIEFLKGNTEFNISEQAISPSSASAAEQSIQLMDGILASFKFTK